MKQEDFELLAFTQDTNGISVKYIERDGEDVYIRSVEDARIPTSDLYDAINGLNVSIDELFGLSGLTLESIKIRRGAVEKKVKCVASRATSMGLAKVKLPTVSIDNADEMMMRFSKSVSELEIEVFYYLNGKVAEMEEL